MNLDDIIELNIKHSRCSICDGIYENVSEKREGICETCSKEIDLALREMEEDDENLHTTPEEKDRRIFEKDNP